MLLIGEGLVAVDPVEMVAQEKLAEAVVLADLENRREHQQALIQFHL